MIGFDFDSNMVLMISNPLSRIEPCNLSSITFIVKHPAPHNYKKENYFIRSMRLNRSPIYLKYFYRKIP